MKLGASFAIFVIFFGVALYEAIAIKNWIYAGVFLLLGILSLYADNKKEKKKS